MAISDGGNLTWASLALSFYGEEDGGDLWKEIDMRLEDGIKQMVIATAV